MKCIEFKALRRFVSLINDKSNDVALDSICLVCKLSAIQINFIKHYTINTTINCFVVTY